MHITPTLYTKMKKTQNMNPLLMIHSFSDINLKAAAEYLEVSPKRLYNYINNYRRVPLPIANDIRRLASQLDHERELFLSEVKNNQNNLEVNDNGKR